MFEILESTAGNAVVKGLLLIPPYNNKKMLLTEICAGSNF